MNVVVTAELYRLALNASRRTTYRALPARNVYMRITGVYAYAMLVACTIFFHLPVKAGAQRGLACLPMTTDIWSELFFWAVFVNAMLGIPLCAICFFSQRVYTLLWKTQGKDREANRELFVFFARLLVVFLGMWLPTALLIWMVVWDGSTFFQWIGGSFSHLQGVVSAMLYLRKRDILKEIRKLGCGFLCCTLPSPEEHNTSASVGEESATAISHTHQPPSTSAAPYVDLEQPVTAEDATVERSFAARKATRRPSAAELSETDDALEMLASSAQAAIVANQEAQMVVIPYQTWMEAGHLPRSSDGFARPLSRSDCCIFISHRWWRPEERQPDDAEHTKYAIISRGLRELVRRHHLDEANVVLWIECVAASRSLSRELSHLPAALLPTPFAYACLFPLTHAIFRVEYRHAQLCLCKSRPRRAAGARHKLTYRLRSSVVLCADARPPEP